MGLPGSRSGGLFLSAVRSHAPQSGPLAGRGIVAPPDRAAPKSTGLNLARKRLHVVPETTAPSIEVRARQGIPKLLSRDGADAAQGAALLEPLPKASGTASVQVPRSRLRSATKMADVPSIISAASAERYFSPTLERFRWRSYALPPTLTLAKTAFRRTARLPPASHV